VPKARPYIENPPKIPISLIINMKTFRITTLLLCLTILSFSAKAQIGYQVSLLNNAAGEPRTNESVNVTIK
jgi:hypothetical protein